MREEKRKSNPHRVKTSCCCEQKGGCDILNLPLRYLDNCQPISVLDPGNPLTPTSAKSLQTTPSVGTALLLLHPSTSCSAFSFAENPLMGLQDLELSMDCQGNLIVAVVCLSEPQMFFSKREYLHSNFCSPPFGSPNCSKVTFADASL
ncbi:hypothetical protein STEG23_006816 [Scotinomys teguina]